MCLLSVGQDFISIARNTVLKVTAVMLIARQIIADVLMIGFSYNWYIFWNRYHYVYIKLCISSGLS